MSLIGLNTNLAALRATRRLADNSAVLRRSFERLSSGLRINRAGDDAAGLAIAAGLNTDSRVYSQGIRNFNDGVGLLSVADGALQELSNVVIRIRELATQSANGTLSVTQRKAVNQEAQQLSKEYTRIVRTTRFNGQLLFDAQFGTLNLQGGYGQQGAIASGLGGVVGTAQFHSVQSLNAVSSAQEPIVGDFNSDGVQDLVVGKLNNTNVELFLGNGDGSFATTGILIDTGQIRPSTLASTDFNGDGKLDIVTGHIIGGTISVILGNGDGSFQSAQQLALPNNASGIAVGDFNGDGNQDIGATSPSSDSVFVVLGNGNGTFSAAQTYSTGTGVGPTWLHTGDFNNDGRSDFAYSSPSVPSVGVMLGNGDGTFQAAQNISTGVSSISQLELGDLNGDNNLDIIGVAGTSVVVLLGNGNSTFQAQQTTSAGTSLSDLQLGDLNGDGLLDVFASDSGASSFSVLLGNGGGGFQIPTTVAAGAISTFVVLGDFNGDGVPDAAAVMPGPTVGIFLGNTTSGTAPLLPFDLSSRHQALAAIPDLDRALDRISLQRGTIGAFLSRVDTGIANLGQSRESVQAAFGRIMDADIATDAAELTRSQILQQASSAILTQANMLPALALSLLR